MNLNRSQVSLSITCLLMSLFVWLLCNIHLSAVVVEEQGIAITLADETLEEAVAEAKKQRASTQMSAIKSHKAVNETAKSLPPKIQEAPQKALPARDTEASDFTARLKQAAAKRRAQQQRLAEQAAQKEVSANASADRHTSVSYALIDRTAYSLPPPIYTCIEGGKVVINIKVNAKGYVTRATLNTKSSETRNRCLIDNAIAYALRAQFSPGSQRVQQGTITYLFQGK